ncbi:MAG: HigA family addiction module antidote protein [Gammaproteobacteria bacterium]|nr:HigA family addiction module antidote protein [Gammaproteobacteria bacterium]
MIITKRKPVSIGEMLTEEFMGPLNIDQGQLAKALGVARKTVNELCNNKTGITADTALMLATVFGNTAEFWLNLQKRNDLWNAMHSKKRMNRISKARPLFSNNKETFA